MGPSIHKLLLRRKEEKEEETYIDDALFAEEPSQPDNSAIIAPLSVSQGPMEGIAPIPTVLFAMQGHPSMRIPILPIETINKTRKDLFISISEMITFGENGNGMDIENKGRIFIHNRLEELSLNNISIKIRGLQDLVFEDSTLFSNNEIVIDELVPNDIQVLGYTTDTKTLPFEINQTLMPSELGNPDGADIVFMISIKNTSNKELRNILGRKALDEYDLIDYNVNNQDVIFSYDDYVFDFVVDKLGPEETVFLTLNLNRAKENKKGSLNTGELEISLTTEGVLHSELKIDEVTIDENVELGLVGIQYIKSFVHIIPNTVVNLVRF